MRGEVLGRTPWPSSVCGVGGSLVVPADIQLFLDIYIYIYTYIVTVCDNIP